MIQTDWTILLVRSFTARMPLLMATNAFRYSVTCTVSVPMIMYFN